MRINSIAMLFKYMRKGVAFEDRQKAKKIQSYESILRRQIRAGQNLMFHSKPTYSAEYIDYDDSSSSDEEDEIVDVFNRSVYCLPGLDDDTQIK